MDRRRYLLLGSSVLTLGIAGCSENSSDGGDGDDEDESDDETEDGTADDDSTNAGTETGGTDGGMVTGDPEAVVRDFYAALDDGDTDRAGSLVHPNSPQREGDELFSDDQSVQTMDESTLTVENTTVAEQTSEGVIVSADIRVERNGNGQTGSIDIELRQSNGNWRIWNAGQ